MNYKNPEESKNIKTIIFMSLIIVVCIVIGIITNIRNNSSSRIIDPMNISTIKEAVEYHESKYISENDSAEPGYYKDVYVVFKYEPYVEETDEVNREYYEDLLEEIAKVILYRSYIIRDNEKDITIKVICKEGRLDRIILNDIEDYFTYIESKISSKNFEKIEDVNLEVTSDIITNLINEGWQSGYDFGEKSSLFNNYETYLNSGLRVRKIQDKVYNVVFTEDYEGTIIENLTPSSSTKQVKSMLGEPSFEDEELDVVGYKTKDFYVFFGNGEASVYRTYSGNVKEFFDLADKYFSDKYTDSDLLNFMNDLTYMWKDYTTYQYTGSSVFLSYPLKGIEIKINFEGENGILIYNNVKSELSAVRNHLESTSYTSKLQIDSVFEAEKRRRNEENQIQEKIEEYKEELADDDSHGESLRYEIYPLIDSNGYINSMKFVSQVKELPNRELNDTISDYYWEDDSHFLYLKEGSGCFIYDLDTGRVSTTLDEEYIDEIRTRDE